VLALAVSWSGSARAVDFPSTVLSQNPVGYWRLNETVAPPTPRPAANSGSLGSAGDGNYQLGPKRGEPGAFTGGSATSTRFFNPNLDITFGGSRVEVPYNNAFNPTGAFSVEFWAKPNDLVKDVFCPIASLNSDSAIGTGPTPNPRAGWLFYQYASTNITGNQWQFRMGNTSNYQDDDNIIAGQTPAGMIHGGTATPGTWSHVVGTFDGTNAVLYVDGAAVASHTIKGFEPNDARPLRIATTCFDGALSPTPGSFAGNRGFDGWIEEVAFYPKALSAADIAAHYNAAKSNGANYPSVVLASGPVGYWRLNEPGNPPAANLGSLGPNGNGQYVYAASPGQPGPQPPSFPGFDTANRACGFNGTNGAVDLPPLNLNTNTVTITAWILANSIQPANAAIVLSHEATTIAGLKFDINDPNGLSYNWNGDPAAANFKSSLAVPTLQWCFVGLIVQPDQATLCLQDGNQFSTAVNFATHVEQAFEGETLIGADAQDPSLTFDGSIDEVAIFNRALAVGEVYSQYAAAVGGLKPRIFTDLQAPAGTVFVGDPLVLSVDAGGTPPLTFTWRKGGQPITGAPSSLSYIVPQAALSDSGTYDVVISNAQGPTNSAQVTISVQPVTQPTISQGPQSRTLYAGGSWNLSVQASGGGLTYQWQRNQTNIIGATNAVYAITNATANDAGTYQVTASNAAGNAPSSATISVIVPTPGSYEATLLADGPEAWWRLDDTPGATTMTDAMGRHDGVYKGTVTLGVTGALATSTNLAATFDGSSAYAEVPFSKALNTTNFTVECWLRANPVTTTLCPFSSFTDSPARGYLVQSAVGEWYYLYGDGSNLNPAFGSDALYGKWVHLAVTYDGRLFSGYLNGRLDGLDNQPFVANNSAPFRIGLDQIGNNWGDYWNGDIDDVAFYQKALTADQIAAHYAAALYGTNSKPAFVQQPHSSSSVAGAQFFFGPVVEGSFPILLQWTKNGVPIAGETNIFIAFNGLSYSDSGVYRLTATNAVGGVVSAPATLSVLPDPAFANLTNGLVLHLPFEQSLLDTSGRANNGKTVGSPNFVPGVIGKSALHYSTIVSTNGPSKVVTAANYVNLGTLSDLKFSSNVNFSVSFWIRFTGAPGDLPFFSNAINSFNNPGYVFAPSYQQGGWSWSLGDSGSTASVGIYGPPDSINDGNWHHVAHTFDRSGSGITYVDGNEVDSRSVVPAGDLDSGNATTIGQDPTGAYPEAGDADIDDVGVWRRVLTGFEVYTIFAVGQSGTSFDTYGPVALSVTSDAGNVQLVWQAGTLQAADALSGPWLPVNGAQAPFYSLPPSGAHKFYRVQL
jgi:hypothetical protein